MKKILIFLSLILTINASQVGINEQLGTMIPLDLDFINEEGERVTLKKLMNNKPTIISLNYFRCAGVCTPQLQEMAQLLSHLKLIENRDYKVLTISFLNNETPTLAKEKRLTHLNSMSRNFNKDAWHFIVSDNNSTSILAKKIGFSYQKIISNRGSIDYIHPTSLIILSPKGKITRYFYGTKPSIFDIKLALLEAGNGKVGATIEKNLIYCFAYDSKTKKYVFKWEKIVTTIMLFIMLLFFIYLVKTTSKINYRS